MTLRHGMRNSAEYNIWAGMRARCNNPKAKAYDRYGGVGIKVCDRWGDFAAFYVDMGPRPSKSHSIDRIDGKKGYEPGNCRWATPKEQGRNRRTVNIITFNGRTQSVSEWSEEIGIPYDILRGRLRRKWGLSDAFVTPVHSTAPLRRAGRFSPQLAGSEQTSPDDAPRVETPAAEAR